MLIHPVPASEWQDIVPANQQLLKSVGGIPVNDKFLPILGKRHRIKLLYGGYGSGKSVFIAFDLILKCLYDKYFKCYYGRKVFDTVRGSCFETLVDVIEDCGLSKYFSYSKAPTSTMVIQCFNGNKFVPFGGDKAAKLKSIKDPTHIWCEEFDQFEDADEEARTKGDFQLLYPRLRTIKAETEFIGSFNTDPVYEDHWIMKYFFPELYKGEEKPDFDFMEGVEILKLHSIYTDNYFIDQDAYYENLRMASGGNDNILQATAFGAWGVSDNKYPWLYALRPERHVVNNIPFIPGMPVFLSFDFNNDPFACTAWQKSPQYGLRNSFIHGIKEFSGHYKVEEMCQQIKTTFPYSIKYITGDRSGKNEDVGRNQTLYQIIASLLDVPEKSIDTPDSNLEYVDSRALLNTMFANYPNIKLSKQGMPTFIRQCENARRDVKSKKPAALLKDRGLNKNDEFDSGRYFFQTYFNKFAKDTYLRVMNKK